MKKLICMMLAVITVIALLPAGLGGVAEAASESINYYNKSNYHVITANPSNGDVDVYNGYAKNVQYEDLKNAENYNTHKETVTKQITNEKNKRSDNNIVAGINGG
ncbi:MAG: hypothetical protein IJ072_01865 [Oscillospiraceae bacterium]|nr:hypothetical protein [Oscillospiraceae bacterium]